MGYTYIKDFKELGFGLFVHFGLYSIVGKGEWNLHLDPEVKQEKYEELAGKFRVKANWAKELARTAKAAGCRYITLTTRHHDGFSLYDTCGLNTYDAPHSACGRDLIAEFVEASRTEGLVPFFYHTLLDWHNADYRENFPKYIDYLVRSIEILCQNYGKIGGFWFDGMWDRPDEDWQEDRLYGTIRKYQPEAMIINNTGLSELGKVGHPEIDSVTFERGKPCYVDESDRPRAGEMCQILNDHWGYAKNDCNYKSVKELIENLVECRRYNCNFLLNTGLRGNGEVNATDKSLLREIGHWIKGTGNIINNLHVTGIEADHALILTDGKDLYAVIDNVVMTADPNVTREGVVREIEVHMDRQLKSATWLDSGRTIPIKDNRFTAEPFPYGTSFSVRIARLK